MEVRILLGTPFRLAYANRQSGLAQTQLFGDSTSPASTNFQRSAAVAQLAEAAGLNPVQCRIVACLRHQFPALSADKGHRQEALSSEEERRSYKPKVEIS